MQNDHIGKGGSAKKTQKSQQYPGIASHPAGPILYTKKQKKGKK